MRIVRERPARGAQEAPRHPEVDQENTTALEPNNQILAATLDGGDVFSFELGRHLGGLVRAHEARVVDAHPLEAPADERGLELPANALDLRQLRHAQRLRELRLVAESACSSQSAATGNQPKLGVGSKSVPWFHASSRPERSRESGGQGESDDAERVCGSTAGASGRLRPLTCVPSAKASGTLHARERGPRQTPFRHRRRQLATQRTEGISSVARRRCLSS